MAIIPGMVFLPVFGIVINIVGGTEIHGNSQILHARRHVVQVAYLLLSPMTQCCKKCCQEFQKGENVVRERDREREKCDLVKPGLVSELLHILQ